MTLSAPFWTTGLFVQAFVHLFEFGSRILGCFDATRSNDSFQRLTHTRAAHNRLGGRETLILTLNKKNMLFSFSFLIESEK